MSQWRALLTGSILWKHVVIQVPDHHPFAFPLDITPCPELCKMNDKGSLWSLFFPPPSFLTSSDEEWATRHRHALKTSKSTTEGTSLVSWGELLSEYDHAGHEGICFLITYGLHLSISETEGWCWQKMAALAHSVKERGRTKRSWLSESWVCVYLLLVVANCYRPDFLRQASECLLQYD